MTVSVVSTDQAPAAVGPYSQAIRIAQIFPSGEGSIVYSSGQIGLDPASGKLVPKAASKRRRARRSGISPRSPKRPARRSDTRSSSRCS